MNDNSLQSHFRALRDDDASRAPAFESFLSTTSPHTPRQPAPLLWPWQLALGGTSAVIAVLALSLNPSPDLATDTLNALASSSDPFEPAWEMPSDDLLALPARSTASPPETTAQLIRDIDRLLKTPSPL